MFKVRPFETKTISWWYRERANIDMNPSYQRKGGLWSTNDKSFLIDSILNDFDLPKIYIADFSFRNNSLNSAGCQYSVIDGRQRLEAIFDFFENKITLDSDFIWVEDQTLNLGGLSYGELVRNYPDVASKFQNFNLSVMSVITDEETKINEMFVRLNRSKSLTGAEIRNAMKGIVPAVTREIASQEFFREKIRFSTLRGQDLNTAAKLLLIEFIGDFTQTKKRSLDAFVEEAVKSESSDLESAAGRVKMVLGALSDEFIDQDPLLGSQGQIPVYYWLLRNFPQAKGRFREFILGFERSRKAIRVKSREDGAVGMNSVNLDDYLLYDSFNRSVNDEGSLRGRYKILVRHLVEFMNNEKPFAERTAS